MKKVFKLAAVSEACVACGSCERVCPVAAIAVDRGLIAVVNAAACIGCGRCAKACPAGVISIVERGVSA